MRGKWRVKKPARMGEEWKVKKPARMGEEWKDIHFFHCSLNKLYSSIRGYFKNIRVISLNNFIRAFVAIFKKIYAILGNYIRAFVAIFQAYSYTN
jgi:hypothetical protein